ncbi:invasion associated locus B family protein [Labrys miyagiensis]|nr:invasion associated locus B family protein [Labrys miyagiensis]
MMSPLLRIALIATAVALSGSALAAPRKPKPEAPAPAAPAAGQQPAALGQFGDWQAFQNGNGKSKSCFAIASPKDRKPAKLKRDPATLFITRRPGEGVRNEISMITGFTMKDGGDATLKVGRSSFTLYTKGSNAWVKNAAEEGTVVGTMRKSKDAVFEGASKRGNKTTDRYSLDGLPQALDAIAKGCP